MDTFNKETTLLVGFIATDGTVATFKFESEDEAAPGAIYRYFARTREEMEDRYHTLGQKDRPPRGEPEKGCISFELVSHRRTES